MAERMTYREEVYEWIREHIPEGQILTATHVRAGLPWIPLQRISSALLELGRDGVLKSTGHFSPDRGRPRIWRVENLHDRPRFGAPRRLGVPRKSCPSHGGRKKISEGASGEDPSPSPSPSPRDLIDAALEILSQLDSAIQNLEQLAHEQPSPEDLLPRLDETAIWREIKRRRAEDKPSRAVRMKVKGFHKKETK